MCENDERNSFGEFRKLIKIHFRNKIKIELRKNSGFVSDRIDDEVLFAAEAHDC